MKVFARVIEQHNDHHGPAQQINGIDAPSLFTHIFFNNALHVNLPSVIAFRRNSRVIAEIGQRFWHERAEVGMSSSESGTSCYFAERELAMEPLYTHFQPLQLMLTSIASYRD